MLVTLAITAMIGISITSVLMAIVTNSRRDALQTDAYESLRLAAHQIMQDARFAREANTGPGADSLTLYTGPGYADYIMYTFAACTGGDPNNPTPDPTNLHRWVVEGGCEDEIIASNLVPPQWGNPDTTEFGADSGSTTRWARATLVREPLPGQQTPIRIQVFALQR